LKLLSILFLLLFCSLCSANFHTYRWLSYLSLMKRPLSWVSTSLLFCYSAGMIWEEKRRWLWVSQGCLTEKQRIIRARPKDFLKPVTTAMQKVNSEIKHSKEGPVIYFLKSLNCINSFSAHLWKQYGKLCLYG
jgi:hypothetical protein